MAKLFGNTLKKKDVSEQEKPLFAGEESSAPDIDIEDLVMEGRRKIGAHEGIKDTPFPVGEISSSEVKDFLKEKIGNLTIEGTIHEMYVTIKGMETQLRKVLDINSSLENDLQVTKETKIKENKDNDTLKDKLKNLEEEGPLKMELERELKQLITQHSKKQEDVQDIMSEKDEMMLNNNILKKNIERLEEEKKDTLRDASFLQSKVDDLVGKIRNYDERLNKARGENAYFKEKITKLEEEVSALWEERNAIQLELKESKEAFDEIYDALIETRVKTKKFFYEELKDK